MFEGIKRAAEASSFEESVLIETRLAQHYQDNKAKNSDSEDDLDRYFEPLEDEQDLFRFPFAEWIKGRTEDEDIEEATAIAPETESAQDPTQACPYLAGKAASEGQTATVPADHPNIPGVDFSDPDAAKSCPFLSAKAASKEPEVKERSTVPVDHPNIPGVDFNDPEAVKACPFLSAKKNGSTVKVQGEEEIIVQQSTTLPSDHPTIPGVDFSNPEAVKACPFLSAKAAAANSSAGAI